MVQQYDLVVLGDGGEALGDDHDRLNGVETVDGLYRIR